MAKTSYMFYPAVPDQVTRLIPRAVRGSFGLIYSPNVQNRKNQVENIQEGEAG